MAGECIPPWHSSIMHSSVPTIAQCLMLMDEYEMYENIRRHSCKVAQVAEALHRGLQRAEKTAETIPAPEVVMAGALMHDIAKTQCLKENCKHAIIGEEICRQLGYPEIGHIVRDHVTLTSFTVEKYSRGIFGATELVYYADKRVKHDQIVSLESRLSYILEHYGDNNPLKEAFIVKNFTQCQDLESYLFSYLDFAPAELSRHLSPDLFPASTST